MKSITSSLALCAVLISSGSNAALESRLGGLAVYDTDLNVSWLANANLAATETFGLATAIFDPFNPDFNLHIVPIYSNGRMTWAGAMDWVGAMNADNYLGYSDWRLPTSVPCGGYNCTDSEMGHLFYSELGGVAGQYITTTHNANYGLFQNVSSIPEYWSTEYVSYGAWFFGMDDGYQGVSAKSNTLYTLAVRDGDVAAVPVPVAAWLLGSGLLGMIGVARRKAA